MESRNISTNTTSSIISIHASSTASTDITTNTIPLPFQHSQGCTTNPPTAKSPKVKALPFKISGPCSPNPNPSYSNSPTTNPPKVKVIPDPGKIGRNRPTSHPPTAKRSKVKVSPKRGQLKPNTSHTSKTKTDKTKTKNTRTDTYNTNASEYSNTIPVSSIISSHPSPGPPGST